jgi:photosystem II stability/assembly factor-like uncharacterized protein
MTLLRNLRCCSQLRLLFFVGIALANTLGSTVRADAPRPTVLTFYERFIAIDGACGWPNLSLLPDGRIAALIWPHSNHGATEGAAECWVSDDGGQTWRKAGIPVPHTPTHNRMNVAAGPIDGRIIALVGGWNLRRPYTPGPSAGPYKPEGSTTITAIPTSSADGGQTWTAWPEPDLPARPNGRALVPYGRIAKLADGSLGVCLYGDGVYFFISTDGGATWSRHGTIVAAPLTHNETTWIRLDNGDLFAAVRTYGDQCLEGFRSTDGGRTWRCEGPLTMPLQIPGDLLKLPDGRVLFSYGARNRGLYGIWVRMGDPELKAWSAPMLLVDFEGSSEFQQSPVPSSDGGYPSTVQLADGTFVTAYYSRGVPQHQRYHVGVVRWKLHPNGLLILKRPAP